RRREVNFAQDSSPYFSPSCVTPFYPRSIQTRWEQAMDALADGALLAGTLLGDTGAGLGSGLAMLFDELAHGVAIATAEGRLLHVNQAARIELARRRVLLARNDMLHAASPESHRILHEALGRTAEGKRSLVELAAPAGPGLTI